MRLNTSKGFRDYEALTAQFEDAQGAFLDDPDWYEPTLTPEGVVYCVRPSLAPSPAKRALGLSPLRNHPSRYGLDGVKSGARKKIRLTAKCLGKFERRNAFGAFTPSPPDFFSIEASEGGASGFQWQLGKALSEMYVRRGKDACWLLVPEITPQLSESQGRPMVHWHVLAVNKRSRFEKGWWLSIEDWREVYATAFKRHTGSDPIDARASVSLRLARNPAKYLAKYLSKNPSGLGGIDFEGHEEAIPRQWFSSSKPAKRLVKESSVRLPAAFADYLWLEWRVLEAEGLGSWRTFVMNERTGWEVGAFQFKDLVAIGLAWERFVVWARPANPPDVGEPIAASVVPAGEHEGDFSVFRLEMGVEQLSAQPVVEQLSLVAI